MKDCIISLKSSKEIDHILYFVIFFIITFFLLTTIIGSSSSSADTENGVSTSETSPLQPKNTDEDPSKFSADGIKFGITIEEAISAINKINPYFLIFNFSDFYVEHFNDDKTYKTENEDPKNKGFVSYLKCEHGCSLPYMVCEPKCPMQSDIITVLYYEGVGVWGFSRKYIYNENEGPTRDVVISYFKDKYNIPNSYNFKEDTSSRIIEDIVYFDLSNKFASSEICPNLSKAKVVFEVGKVELGRDNLTFATSGSILGQASPSCGAYVAFKISYDGGQNTVTELSITTVSIKHRYQYLRKTDQLLTPYEKE
jgi:hypothetical protein